MTTIAARLRIGPGATATRQERLAYRLLLPVFGTVVVVATIPFVLAVIESVTRDGRVRRSRELPARSEQPAARRVGAPDRDLRV